MIMNLMNMLCSRNLSETGMNFFKNIFSSWLFIFSFLAQIAIQNGMQYGAGQSDTYPIIGIILGNCEMTMAQHITCWSLGFGVILVQIINKKIPGEKFDKICNKIDLENKSKDDFVTRSTRRLVDRMN